MSMKCVDDFRQRFGKQELVPIVIGGMGVDISTAELALEAARLGGVGHISQAAFLYTLLPNDLLSFPPYFAGNPQTRKSHPSHIHSVKPASTMDLKYCISCAVA